MHQVTQSVILIIIALAMVTFIISGAVTLSLSHSSSARAKKSVLAMSKVTIACSTTAFAAAFTGAIIEHLAH